MCTHNTRAVSANVNCNLIIFKNESNLIFNVKYCEYNSLRCHNQNSVREKKTNK